jgi:hypothetical protein
MLMVKARAGLSLIVIAVMVFVMGGAFAAVVVVVADVAVVL